MKIDLVIFLVCVVGMCILAGAAAVLNLAACENSQAASSTCPPLMALVRCQRWGVVVSAYHQRESHHGNVLPHFAPVQAEKLQSLRTKAKAKPQARGACTHVALHQFFCGQVFAVAARTKANSKRKACLPSAAIDTEFDTYMNCHCTGVPIT